MKDIFKTPFEDSDPESETEEAEASESDEDVSMRSVARAYEQNNMDTSESDNSYVESGSSGSEAHSSDSSMASSVSTDAKSEVSEVSVSEAEEDEDEDKAMASVKDDEGKAKSACYALLFKEINEEQLNSNLPTTCELVIEDPNDLSKLQIRIIPEGGYWQGGIFQFNVTVPEDYNEVPPEVKCVTKVFHPNISEDGTVGLHIIRQDGAVKDGWNSKLQLKDVMLGINSLFTDPVDVKDPFNSEAAKLFKKDKKEFGKRIMDCIKAMK